MPKPAAERRQHHDLEAPQVDARAFRQGWCIRTKLDALLADERITPAEWQAADEYRTTWERVFAITGMRSLDIVPIGGGDGRGADARQVALLDFNSRVRAVERKIGPLAARLCQFCIIEDHSWAEIGRRARRDPHTVQNWTVLAIRALAAYW